MTFRREVLQRMTDAYFVCVYALTTGAFVSLFVDFRDTAGYGTGSPIFKVIWGLVYIISMLRLIARRNEVTVLCGANKLLISIVVLALTSVLWSIDWSATLHLAVTLALTTLVALDLSMSYSIKRQLELLCVALVLIVALSAAVEVFLPGVIPGNVDDGQAWHGVFAFKNNFGRVICLTVVAGFSLFGGSKFLQWLVFVSGIALSMLSKSSGSVGYTIVLVGSVLLWPLLKWRPKPRAFAIVVLSIAALSAVYYVSENFGQVLAMADKDPHMTGRVDLWQMAIPYIQAKPLLGYGYGAFWTYNSQPATRIREAVHWDEAPHAHNAYIDLELSLGALGIVIYFVAYFIVAKDALRLFLNGTESYQKWPLSYLAFVLLYQCTESGIVGGNNILWIVFASLAFSLSLAREHLRLEMLPMTSIPVSTTVPSIS
jgi:exopolysaccharide production protein ExoQ